MNFPRNKVVCAKLCACIHLFGIANLPNQTSTCYELPICLLQYFNSSTPVPHHIQEEFT